MNYLYLVLLSILSGVLYRLGGVGKPWNTKVRDFGCPLISLFTMWAFFINTELVWTFVYLLFSFGVMTTYWEHWGTDDVEWYEWALTGWFYGVSALPIAIYTGRFTGFFIRAILLTILVALWSETIDDVDIEEFGRGFLFNVTIPLLLI